jgi:phosphoribosylaminoimidazole-succinocarboxamide synthase
LLIVTTDRISAFDCVLPVGIPDKGIVLNQISMHWFRRFAGRIPGHVVTAAVGEMPAALRPFEPQLRGRAMLVRRARVLPVECIVRGYLAGSGWNEYRKTGTVCGLPLPAGLAESGKLPAPIFTPSTKAVVGHDENISFERMGELVGAGLAARVRDASLGLYLQAAGEATARGIIIADTKFEFGLIDGTLTLVDEVLSPDSSRFWPADQYRPGGSQPSFDKQYVRDYLLGLDWDRQPPAPPLPEEVVWNTSKKYLEAYQRLTGEDLLARLDTL